MFGLDEISYAELIGFVFGIIYILVAAREYMHSWIYGLISAICIIIVNFAETKLYMSGLLHVLYACLAMFGITLWLTQKRKPKTIRISRISNTSYVGYLMLALLIGMAAGYLLKIQTDAHFPFIDSFISVLALFSTFLVIYRVLDVWTYWILINVVSTYLYWQTGAVLLALLFICYLISNITKWQQWRLEFVQQSRSV